MKKQEDGTEVIIANDAPVDMVVDNYAGGGHVFIAKDIGAGLSFMTGQQVDYGRDDRVCVSVKISDIINQGGLIYKITSLPAYITAFFVTLPMKELQITRID